MPSLWRQSVKCRKHTGCVGDNRRHDLSGRYYPLDKACGRSAVESHRFSAVDDLGCRDRTPLIGPLAMRVVLSGLSPCRGVGGGGLPVEASVWPAVVVGVSPFFDDGLRLKQRVKGLHGEHFVADA